MIDRRRFVAITAASAALVSVPTKGQPTGKVWRIGFLSTGSPPTPVRPIRRRPLAAASRAGLR